MEKWYNVSGTKVCFCLPMCSQPAANAPQKRLTMKKMMPVLPAILLAATSALAQTPGYVDIMCAIPNGNDGAALHNTKYGLSGAATPNGTPANLPDASWIWGSGSVSPFIYNGGNRIGLRENATLGYPLASAGDYIKPPRIKVHGNLQSFASPKRIGYGFWPDMTQQCRGDNPFQEFTGFYLTTLSNDNDRRIQLYENGVPGSYADVPVGNFTIDFLIDTTTGGILSLTLGGVSTNFVTTAFSNTATQVIGAFDYQGGSANPVGVIYQGGFKVSSDVLFRGSVHNIDNITAETATLHGRVLNIPIAATGFFAAMCWGFEDAGENTNAWDNVVYITSPVLGTPFSVPLTNLDVGSNYVARLYIADNLGNEAFSLPKTFTTPADVELGNILPSFTPNATNLIVNVTKAGLNATLTLAWGDNLANTNQISNVAAGSHSFPISGIPNGERLHYHATIEATQPEPVSDTKSGSFLMRFNYTWTRTSNGNWNDVNNWDVQAVPDLPGADVTINHSYAGTLEINLAGMTSATLGQLNLNPYASQTINLGVGLGTVPIILDNFGATAFITATLANATSRAVINTPLELPAETHAAIINSNPNRPLHFVCPISGIGPLHFTGGYHALNVPAGRTHTITLPLMTSGDATVCKAGDGNLIIKGGVHSIAFSGNSDDTSYLIGNTGSLILDNTIITNTSNLTIARLFQYVSGNITGTFCSLVITNGALLTYQFPHTNNGGAGESQGVFFNNNDNTILVTGPGSTFEPPYFRASNARNTIRVEDGGTLRLRHSNLAIYGNSASLRVDGGTLDLNTHNLDVRAGTGNNICLLPNGVITNGTVAFTSATPATLNLHGGELHATDFTFNNGHILAPIVAQNLQPIRAMNATLGETFRVVPTNPADTLGVFPLIVSDTPITFNGDLETVFEPPQLPRRVWKLNFNDDNTQLLLSCKPYGTLLFVR